MITLGVKVDSDAGPGVVVNCLWCGRQAVNAQTRQQTEWLTLLHLVPVFRNRNVFVRCSACEKDMIAKCSLADVAYGSPVTLQHHLVKCQSFVGRVCILVGVLLCWAPMIGLIAAGIGFFYRNQFGQAMRTLSRIGLIVSLLTTALGITALLLSHATSQPQ
jgi:hypothetical protein